MTDYRDLVKELREGVPSDEDYEGFNVEWADEIMDRAADAITALREAAEALVRRLDAIHADPQYVSVWTLNQIHCGPYAGPKYTDELSTLRSILAALDAATSPSGEPPSTSSGGVTEEMVEKACAAYNKDTLDYASRSRMRAALLSLSKDAILANPKEE